MTQKPMVSKIKRMAFGCWQVFNISSSYLSWTVDDSHTVRLDQTSSDSQCSPTDEFSSKATDLLGAIESSPADTPDAGHPIDIDHTKAFERAGIQINFADDEISVDVSHSTGLRKTGFSDDLYADDLTVAKKSLSKIPRSPMARRKSIDNTSSSEVAASNTGLPLGTRKAPVYRSIRTSPSHTGESSAPASPKHTATASSSTNNSGSSSNSSKAADAGTWNGRMATPKRRPSLGSESFQPLAPRSRSGSATNLSPAKTFQRNETRSSRCQYDQNGRRITKSTNTSPVKHSSSPIKHNSSPLAQQILEAAECAKNDSQMLEKMKLLLSKYTVSPRSGKTLSRSRSSASPSPIKQKEEFEDFTTAWVNSNGSLDRASNCCAPAKAHSKRSSAASSCDSNGYKADYLVAARRERGVSRIPAPIRQNTELYWQS